MRRSKGPALLPTSKCEISTEAAHAGTDVNVIAWSRLISYLVVSGADDGAFKIWDLRKVRSVYFSREKNSDGHFIYKRAFLLVRLYPVPSSL